MTTQANASPSPGPSFDAAGSRPARPASRFSRAPTTRRSRTSGNACTNPDRLRRWYVPVTGDLRIGGRFEQATMGSGEIQRCEPPHRLTLSLGGGADEIELQLSAGDHGATVLELQHATTIDQHEIGGQMVDAIFCMGGGYYPRFVALDKHLRGQLPDDYDTLTFHQNPEVRPVIERGSAAMAALLEADALRKR